MTATTWLDVSTENCSIQRALSVIGEKWTLLLIRDASNGVRRFDDFRRHVGLSEAVLSDRLKTLVACGIFSTREYQAEGQRRRREYRLSAKGWELYPVLIGLLQWGDKYFADEDGPVRVIEHKEFEGQPCGHPVRAVVVCTHDGAEVAPWDARAVNGPGAKQIGESFPQHMPKTLPDLAG
jgi:DNA-binding HxlR family transcriptional regulator